MLYYTALMCRFVFVNISACCRFWVGSVMVNQCWMLDWLRPVPFKKQSSCRESMSSSSMQSRSNLFLVNIFSFFTISLPYSYHRPLIIVSIQLWALFELWTTKINSLFTLLLFNLYTNNDQQRSLFFFFFFLNRQMSFPPHVSLCIMFNTILWCK